MLKPVLPSILCQVVDQRRLQADAACPVGTTSAYADEALGFRFHSDGITTDMSDGSLRWEAAEPSNLGLAFTMTRPDDEEAYTVFSATRSSSAPVPDYSQVKAKCSKPCCLLCFRACVLS